VVLLFEILEVNPQLIIDNQLDKLTAELYYPVAWAYLRPLGTAHIHTSRSRLQLFKYKFNYSAEAAEDWPYDLRTPAVFLDFDWVKKEKYPSYLEIDFQFINKSNVSVQRQHFSRAPWEKEIGLYPYDPLGQEDQGKDEE